MTRRFKPQRMSHEHFERRVAQDQERAQLHKRKIRYQAGSYRATCSCSWVSAPFHTRPEAETAQHP